MPFDDTTKRVVREMNNLGCLCLNEDGGHEHAIVVDLERSNVTLVGLASVAPLTKSSVPTH